MRRWKMAMAGLCVMASAALVFSADDKPRRTQEGRAKRLDPARIISQHDKNDDGLLDKEEAPSQLRERFARIDADSDGKLSKDELEKVSGGLAKMRRRAAADSTKPAETPKAAESAPEKPTSDDARDAVFRLLDTDKDGKLSKEELENAVRLLQRDKNKDGMLDLSELLTSKDGRRRGEIITGAAKGERHQDQLNVGDEAPDFTLPDKSGKHEITLSSFRDKKPVVLIFASYT